MSSIMYPNLRLSAEEKDGVYVLFLAIASGFADFEVHLQIEKHDFEVIRNDAQRTAFLQAALHHPFQLQKTTLSEVEQRLYFDKILHSPVNETEAFLTQMDYGIANGAISNMLRITSGKNVILLRKGQWFARPITDG